MGKKIEVYDFLYVDAPRIKSLIAQLDDDGPLADLTITDSREDERGHDIGGGVGSEHIAETRASRASKRTTGESYQRRYEVQYGLPFDVMRRLDEREIIQRDPARWRFGAIAEFCGDMFLMDFASIHAGWEGMIKHAAGLAAADEAAAMSIFSRMPASVHAVFHRGATKVWSMLVLEHWNIPPQSVTLSLGSFVTGDWKIVGVVDAMPTTKSATEQHPPVDTTFAKPFANLAQNMKSLMGRSADCFGFTPIIVYRSIVRKS